MTYKSGETPQVGDSVMGPMAGALGRGVVARVLPGDEKTPSRVQVRRRAPYAGLRAPLGLQHDEVDQADLELVYRKAGLPGPEAAPEAKAPKGRKKGARA
jgi:hypothetical protein